MVFTVLVLPASPKSPLDSATCASSRLMSSNPPWAMPSPHRVRCVTRTPLPGGFDAYRVNGTPADCVALGTYLWERVSLVLSGINLGPNLGSARWHSGTLAAAKQAALLGLRGIAFSTAVGMTDKAPDFSSLENRTWTKCSSSQGERDVPRQCERARKTERHSVDAAGDQAVRRQSCAEQKRAIY